jgi:hypothetical protein
MPMAQPSFHPRNATSLQGAPMRMHTPAPDAEPGPRESERVTPPAPVPPEMLPVIPPGPDEPAPAPGEARAVCARLPRHCRRRTCGAFRVCLGCRRSAAARPAYTGLRA